MSKKANAPRRAALKPVRDHEAQWPCPCADRQNDPFHSFRTISASALHAGLYLALPEEAGRETPQDRSHRLSACDGAAGWPIRRRRLGPAPG